MSPGRRFILIAAAVLASRLLFHAPVAKADAFADAAQKFIESLADKAIAALTGKDVPRSERVRRFRVLLNEHFAVETIGRWVLGRHWRDASDAERREYLRLFEDLIVKTYVDRFTEYSGEKLTVLKTVVADNQDAIVFTSITRPNHGEPIAVEWRVRAREGHYRIVDVMVTGVSMGLTQHQEFSSVLVRNGGSMAAFLKELRARVETGA